MRTLIVVIKEFFFLLKAAFKGRKADRLKASGDMEAYRDFVDRMVRDWAQKLLDYAGVTVEVHGRENLTGRPVIFVPNHQSDWDIPLLLAKLDRTCGLVAKDSLAGVPVISGWMRRLDCIFLDRNDARKALKTMNDAGRVVAEEGRSIVIFPEGTRSKGEEMGEFKSGAFKTAFKYEVPVQPVCIDGTYKIMEGNGGKTIRPAHVILTFLPPVETAGLERAQQKTFGEEIRQSISDGRERSRNK